MLRSAVIRVILISVVMLFLSVPSFATIVDICGFELGKVMQNEPREFKHSFSSPSYPLVQDVIVRSGNYALESASWTNSYNDVQYHECRVGTDYNATTLYTRLYFRYTVPQEKPLSGIAPIFGVCNVYWDEDDYDEWEVVDLKFYVSLDSNRHLRAYKANGTLLGTGTTYLTPDTWHMIQVKVGTGASAAWEVKLDGSTECSGTSNLGYGTSDCVRLGKLDLATDPNVNIHCFYDDLCMDNSTYPAAGEVLMHRPNGDGTDTDWYASSGNRWQCVDDAPCSAASPGGYLNLGGFSYADYVGACYNFSVYTATLKDTSDVGISGGTTVAAVKAFAICDNAVKIRARQGASYSDSASAMEYRVMPVDPTDSSSWTTTKVDSLQLGVKPVYNIPTKCTALGAMVEYRPATHVEREEVGVALTGSLYHISCWPTGDPNYPVLPQIPENFDPLPNAYYEGGNTWSTVQDYDFTDGVSSSQYFPDTLPEYVRIEADECWAAFQIYTFDVGAQNDLGTIVKIRPFFEGNGYTDCGSECYDVVLYIWNYDAGRWDDLRQGTQDNDNVLYADLDDPSDYITEDDIVKIVLITADADYWETAWLFTDMVSLGVLYTPDE